MFARSAVLALPLLLTPAVVAQTASYSTFGTGCPGSAPGQVLASNNAGATALMPLAGVGNPELALIVNPKTSISVITGFEIFTKATKANITTPAYIYLPDTTGFPAAKPIGIGSLTVTTKLGWHKATFATPVIVKGAATFMISWKWSNIFSKDFEWPQAASGTNSKMYWRAQQGTIVWKGPSTGEPWAWKVLGPGGTRLTPALSNTGLPKIAQTFQLDLTQARASSVGVLVFGASDTTWGPVKLPLAIGSTGCSLLASFDLPIILPTSATGTTNAPFVIPNEKSLLGNPFYNQWLVLDPGANSLNLAFSNGGKGLIGN